MDQRTSQHCHNISCRYISGLEAFLGQKKRQLRKYMQKKGTHQQVTQQKNLKSFQKLGLGKRIDKQKKLQRTFCGGKNRSPG